MSILLAMPSSQHPITVPFINRQPEMAILDAFHDRKGPQFMVVYGRRRIGKTSLLSHWIHGRAKPLRRRGFYWVAHRGTSDALLKGFSEALASCMDTELVGRLSFSSWEDAFQQMFALAKDAPLVAAIDELPYLMESVPGIASLLQNIWDQRKSGSRLRLILCGSQYQMMHAQFTDPKQPLYGRATASMQLGEIALPHLREFLPSYSAIQAVETFSVIGGVPKYLEMWNDSAPVLNNIADLLLSPDTLFRHEALFLIHDEIAEPRTYLAIMEAIGGGLRTPVQIAKTTGLPITHVGKYLHQLLALQFVRRVQSAEAPDPRQTRLSRYEIADAFLRFHFEFIHPHPTFMETRRTPQVMDMITTRFDAYVGKHGYEELARRHVTELSDQGKLPFVAKHLGRAWSPSVEVDIFASDPKAQTALFGECRWNTRKMDLETLRELQTKATGFPRLKKFQKHYILFSRSGFTATLTRAAEAEKVTLVEGPLLEFPAAKARKVRRK
jgi:uncharacterized protein